MPTSDNRGDLVFHPNPASVAAGYAARMQYGCSELAPFTYTTGVAAGSIQGSPMIVPGELVLDFLTMCQRNPKPCPVIPVSNKGAPSLLTAGGGH